MFKTTIMLAIIALLAGSPIAFADSLAEAEARCKQYAQEDNVSADEMKDYIAECVKELTE